jgi:TonB family protein
MDWILFLITNLLFVICVLVFDVFLAKTTNHKLKRVVLLVLPLLAVTFYYYPVSLLNAFPVPSIDLSAVIVGITDVSSSNQNELALPIVQIILTIYGGISFLLLGFSAWSLIRSYNKGSKTASRKAGYSIRTIPHEHSYSLINRIYLAQHDFNNPFILRHEMAHLQQYHWLDSLFAQVITALFWINPMVWRWRLLVKQNHEYLADEKSIKDQGHSQQDYTALLLDKALSTNHFSIEHYFSKHSLISNRIIMLQSKKESSPLRWFAATALIITGVIYLGACSKNSESQINETLTTTEEPAASDEKPLDKVEIMPEFEGGKMELYKFMGLNIKYPQSCKDEEIEGIVYTSFVVSKTGEVQNIKIVKGVHPDMDAEAMRVLSMMPKWTPGKQDGKTVSVAYNMPINFKLTNEPKP